MRAGRLVQLFALMLAFMPAALAEDAVRQVPDTQAGIQLSFAPVVRQVIPSVVNVYATRVSRQRTSPFANDPFFQRFFGGDSPLFGTRPRESHELGSGVIVDSSGIILTNSHVVSGAADIRISTADKREFAVDLILDDPKDDLAVLKVRDAGDRIFPALPFADSDALQVGDLVLAVGNPFGVGQTVTSGIVSAIARTSIAGEESKFFVQTDAAINPGNSGGALVDMHGHLVGINTALYSEGGGSVGIGFAIPANMAKVVAAVGIAGGELLRPWMGARMQHLTSDLADSLGIDPPRGAMITEVAPGGPAAQGGLVAGDVITAIDDAPVGDPEEFAYRFATRPIGTASRLSVTRGGASLVASVTPIAAQPLSGSKVTITGDTRFAGTIGAQIDPAFADELGLPYDTVGVVVADVTVGSPAERMGLRRGDIIIDLQGQKITDLDTFKAVTAQRPRSWRITLQRGGQVLRSVVEG